MIQGLSNQYEFPYQKDAVVDFKQWVSLNLILFTLIYLHWINTTWVLVLLGLQTHNPLIEIMSLIRPFWTQDLGKLLWPSTCSVPNHLQQFWTYHVSRTKCLSNLKRKRDGNLPVYSIISVVDSWRGGGNRRFFQPVSKDIKILKPIFSGGRWFFQLCSWVQNCQNLKIPYFLEGSVMEVGVGGFLTLVLESKNVKISSPIFWGWGGAGISNFCSRVQNCGNLKVPFLEGIGVRVGVCRWWQWCCVRHLLRVWGELKILTTFLSCQLWLCESQSPRGEQKCLYILHYI